MTDVKLAACPLCGKAVQFRKALWPSDGCVDAIIHAEPTDCGMVDYSTGTTDESVIAKWNALPRADGEVGRLRDALTPSLETKQAYMGEFQFHLPDRDEDGNEVMCRVNVPWTTIKEIMAAIRARAALATSQESSDAN